MRPKAIMLTIVCAIAMAVLLGPGRQPSSGQEQRNPTGRTTAHLLCCGRLVSVPGTWFGADRRCTEYLQNAPENVRTDTCKYMKNSHFFTQASCIREMQSICPEAKPPKCKEREGPPWFDPSSEGCQKLQETRMEAHWTPAKGGTCTITFSACGRIALTRKIETVQIVNGKLDDVTHLTFSNYTPQEEARIRARFRPIRERECKPELHDGPAHPQRVCCDIWDEAVRSGGPCNPDQDADCDGTLNSEDRGFYEPPGPIRNTTPYYAPGGDGPDGIFNPVDPRDFNPSDFDPRPPGLAWDELMPNEPCKLCKWVALSGKLTCSPNGRSDHEYKATWKCPVSGVERVVRKRVPARFPCTPPQRPRRTN